MSPKTKQSRREQTQHLCKICNIWIADNKPQRDQHEAGAKHIANRQRVLREIAEQNEKKRAQERREGKRIPSQNQSRAMQQMMELAMQATQGEVKEVESTEDGKQETVIAAQQVDENGYPLPADSVFQWTTVAEEDGGTFQDGEGEEHTDKLEQSETHRERAIGTLVSEKFKAGVKRVQEIDETRDLVAEDAKERSLALAAFTKRKAAAGRKRRRKQ